jgi:hypothetical protein
MLAKCFFDCKEYNRAVRTLEEDAEEVLKADPYALFLYCYSLYLHGEKCKLQDDVQAKVCKLRCVMWMCIDLVFSSKVKNDQPAFR